ncbi:hypothetical protein E2C01_025281 [Portunus trituberculatus]|uniref:Secreted protein n=1 Tax=Portunus trituberculatus TaxID=210409 RepID=A0A5B7ECJ5_PORTR|nr:hypothetical protein [Portunus trituberculatus]
MTQVLVYFFLVSIVPDSVPGGCDASTYACMSSNVFKSQTPPLKSGITKLFGPSLQFFHSHNDTGYVSSSAGERSKRHP